MISRVLIWLSYVGLALAPRRAQGAPQAAALQLSPFIVRNVSIMRFSTLIAASTLPLSGITPDAFKQFKTLQPPAGLSTEIGSFTLDAELFDALDAPPTNLRLFDATGKETPFLLRLKIPLRTVETLHPFAPAKIESFRTLESNRIEMIVARDPKHPQPGALQFESTVRNFEKLVTVAGSTDRQSWTLLATNEPIYDYSRFVDVRRDRVPIASGNYLWYRIEVSNITENKDSPLVEIIRQTRGSQAGNETEATSFRREPFRMDRIIFLGRQTSVVSGEPATHEGDLTNWTATQNQPQQQTVLTFFTPREPLVAIVLKTEEANFSRGVTLEGRATEQDAWQTLASGRITRIRAGIVQQDSMTLTLPREYRGRHFRLTIQNQDNPPLTFAGLRTRYNTYEALFFPKSGATYQVYFGGKEIPAPQYDVATVLAAIPAGSGAQWTPGAAQPNPNFKKQRTTAVSGKTLLTAALILMIAILIPVIIKLSRKIS
jgi:hypothetical protein